jgi:hypothetical protein
MNQRSLWFPVCIHCHQQIREGEERRKAWRATTDVKGHIVKNEVVGSFHVGCTTLIRNP